MRIEISNDLFDITARLREINPNYGVVFDTESQGFEVTLNGKPTLRLPFENLDERTLAHVYYTRSENVFKVAMDLDKSNEELERLRVKKAQDVFEDEYSRAVRLAGANL